MACRWGILSTANIANKNVRAIQSLPEEIAQVVAVASRTLDRAQEFAKKHNIPKVYGSYEELLDDAEIDAVYIPLPTALHAEWVRKAAAKGKHILCDKPVGVNLQEVKQMVEATSTHKVEFMDGVMFMHHKRMTELYEKIHDKEKFGEMRSVNAGFHFFASDDWSAQNIRLKPDLEPMGAFGDLGWYTVRISLFGFDYAWPVAVEARTHVASPDGVPTDFSSALYFDEKQEKKAFFHVSFRQAFQQWVNFSGTHATLLLDDFVIARSPQKVEFSVDAGDLNDSHTAVIRRADARSYDVENCSQETEMMRTFSEAVRRRRSGEKGLDPVWTRHVVQTQAVIDACLESARTNQRISVVKPDWI